MSRKKNGMKSLKVCKTIPVNFLMICNAWHRRIDFSCSNQNKCSIRIFGTFQKCCWVGIQLFQSVTTKAKKKKKQKRFHRQIFNDLFQKYRLFVDCIKINEVAIGSRESIHFSLRDDEKRTLLTDTKRLYFNNIRLIMKC